MSLLADCQSIDDLRAAARKTLPAPFFHFIDGAAEAEWSARNNSAAFDKVSIVPRYVVDVSRPRTDAVLFGQKVRSPIFCSPTGASRLFHPDGEMAVARAAAKAGVFYGLSTGSTYSLEEIAAATDGPKLFQTYIFKDRSLTFDLVDRAKRAGFHALCLTVDCPVSGKRERDYRSGFTRLPSLTVGSAISFAAKPRWVVAQLGRKRIELANFVGDDGRPLYGFSAQEIVQSIDPLISWRDVRDVKERWGGTLVLKGIMSTSDALLALDAGVDALVVSNHGGRQLDSAAAPLDVLAKIATAVGARVEIILDGGVRRGSHVIKALALGAVACSIGRPYLYGLAAGGERGVSRALELLQTELERSMKLSGLSTVSEPDVELIQHGS